MKGKTVEFLKIEPVEIVGFVKYDESGTSEELNARAKSIVSANIIKVTVGTTGYCGGDTGHGGKTFFSIVDQGGTDWDIKINENGFEFILGGDTELETFLEALKFSVKTLEDIIHQKNEENRKRKTEEQTRMKLSEYW